MFRYLAFAAALMVGSANAAVIDAFDLDTSNGNGIDSTAVLAAGVTYDITFSGRFVFGASVKGPRIADAGYIDLQVSPYKISKVRIDGKRISFDTFQESSVYTRSVVGTGDTINFLLADNPYYDNIGSLRISIDDRLAAPAPVPLPAGAFLMIPGLVGLGLIRRRRGRTA